MIVDESHVTISQVHAMYGGDRSRKENLVEYGFRLPAAMDNRPLKFEEFEALQNQFKSCKMAPKTRQGGCPQGLGEAGREKNSRLSEKLLRFSLTLRILSDFGRHFGPQVVPLGSQNRYFSIKSLLRCHFF